MAERDVDIDIDQLLDGAASDTRRWSAQPPVPIEVLEQRASRRKTARLASAGTTALVAIVLAAVVTTVGGSERDGDQSAVSVAAEPPPAVRTATPGDVQTASVNGQVRVEGLPTEGVAVEDGDAVLLLSFDGTELERLPGFRLGPWTQPGELRLADGHGTVYELDALAGVLAPRPPGTEETRSLSYGAAFVPSDEPGEGTVQRDGHALFTIANGEGATFSWDRDIVTRIAVDPTTASVAFDLRTMKARQLPAGCRVADRHGPAWFLLCATGDEGMSIVRLDSDDRTKVLAGPDGTGGWVDAMVSPDGTELLAYTCGSPALFFGSTSGGGLRAADDPASPLPLGWSAGGEAIVHANNACGNVPQRGGVLATDGTAVRWIHESTERAAIWTPLLQHR